jgi:CubicO group peptidase (beta-lactamase class C family)
VSIGSYLPDQRCRAGLAWNLSSVTREGTPHPKPIHRFQALLQDRLFTPLGLKDTLFPPSTSSAIPDPHPQGYLYGNNVLTMGSPAAVPPDMQAAAKAGTLRPSDQTSLNPSWAWAAGAGISTVADLATWVEALADGKRGCPGSRRT